MEFVDCQNLAGSFSLAAVNAGFRMKHRVAEPGGFGNESVEANRHLLPGSWVTETSPADEWTPQGGVGLLCATPPCSGFSLLNQSKGAKARGADSAINSCMRDVVDYASRCRGSDGQRGPEIVTFESVQGAYKQGRSLMQELRAVLEQKTNQSYDLVHVLHSGASVGAAQLRRRYFFVAARVPFGIESPNPQRVATYQDAIGDLQGLKLQWEAQQLRYEPSWWSGAKRNYDDECADSHVVHENAHVRRAHALASNWAPGEGMKEAARRWDVPPEPWTPEAWAKLPKWLFGDPRRVRPDRAGYVITGSGGADFVHWAEDRVLTVRECLRLMGFPDSWTATSAKHAGQAYVWSGKQMPCESATWLCNWARRALEGVPGAWFGDEIGARERVVDCTNDFLQCYNPRTGAVEDTRSKALREEMARRPA